MFSKHVVDNKTLTAFAVMHVLFDITVQNRWQFTFHELHQKFKNWVPLGLDYCVVHWTSPFSDVCLIHLRILYTYTVKNCKLLRTLQLSVRYSVEINLARSTVLDFLSSSLLKKRYGQMQTGVACIWPRSAIEGETDLSCVLVCLVFAECQQKTERVRKRRIRC